jgi:hypothetical protein
MFKASSLAASAALPLPLMLLFSAQPPIAIDGFSKGVQFGLGMLWVEFEGVMDQMQELEKQAPPVGRALFVCCAVLCCAVLCCAVLCCAVLCCAVL